MDFSELLFHVAKTYNSKGWAPLSKTKLLKLSYLVEYFYYKRNQKKLTDTEWIYYLYGPYVPTIDEKLKSRSFRVERNENEGNDFSIVSIDADAIPIEETATIDIKGLVQTIIDDFGWDDLDTILDYIYFDTEPMLQVKAREEKLDFTTIYPEEKQKIRILDARQITKIIDKHKSRLNHARKI
jgi:hypothetical protein